MFSIISSLNPASLAACSIELESIYSIIQTKIQAENLSLQFCMLKKQTTSYIMHKLPAICET